ncbi:dihydroorotate dehydrogenase [Schistosoma bovis]|uniref:Dihydroorotate dehydrogenase n=1 Tax=Schistosoma bovis TaxID=6184 RepID=A0A430QNY9_SCHBO|nr:dihydroorotate dehydrogenase [Schistosoma bovis]
MNIISLPVHFEYSKKKKTKTSSTTIILTSVGLHNLTYVLHCSKSQKNEKNLLSIMSRIRTSLGVLSLGFGLFTAEALYSGNEHFYKDWFLPTARILVRDGETAHNLSVYLASHGFIPHRPRNSFPHLKCKVFGLEFDHPIGLAAGFDKNGEAFMGLLNAGFSHIEVGTVTPDPQPVLLVAFIHSPFCYHFRCGFNSDGHDAVYERLKDRPWEGRLIVSILILLNLNIPSYFCHCIYHSQKVFIQLIFFSYSFGFVRRGVIGVNLGCNKTSTDPTADYVAGVRKFGEVADYLVINVSSPNTPGLRSLQTREKLRDLLSKVLSARNQLLKKTPILLKISPDENDQSLKDIVEVALDSKTRIDGMIISNTTLATYEEAVACGAAPIPGNNEQNVVCGGLSGRPLFEKSTDCLRKVSALTKGAIPLIGVGGISCGEDALSKLNAGASLVQLYTSFVYQGPPVAHKVAREINELKMISLTPD